MNSINDPLWTEAWRSVWMTSNLKGIPWYAILGNHDYHQGLTAAYTQMDRMRTDDDEWQMPGLVYTVRSPHLTLVCIDTASLAPHETDATEVPLGGAGKVKAALDVVDREIAAAALEEPDWLVVAGHYPIRSVGEHGNTLQLSDLLLPILQRRRVDLYICGHDHTLQHLRDDNPSRLEFIVSGNGAKHGYVQEFHNISQSPQVPFASTIHGFTAHTVSRDALRTTFISLDGDRVYTTTQFPWRPKCGADDCPPLPLEEEDDHDDTVDDDDSNDGSRSWHLGTNAGVVLGLLAAFSGCVGGALTVAFAAKQRRRRAFEPAVQDDEPAIKSSPAGAEMTGRRHTSHDDGTNVEGTSMV